MDMSDDESVKLLNPKDTVINDENVNSENILQSDEQVQDKLDTNDEQKANGHCKTEMECTGTLPPCTERRSDEPTELSFERGISSFLI